MENIYAGAYLKKLDNIFKRQIIKQYSFCSKKPHKITSNPKILYCYLLAKLLCKKNYSKKKISIISQWIWKLYQKKVVLCN